MKKEKALDLLSKFPTLTKELKTEILQKLQPFILFNHKDVCRCTNCGDMWSTDTAVMGHKEKMTCPNCGIPAITIDCTKNYAGRTVESEANAFVFMSSPNDDNLYIRCFWTKMYFEHGKLTPRIALEETQRYVFTESGIARYGRDKVYIWNEVRSTKTDYGDKHCGYYDWSLKNEWTVRTKVEAPNFYNQRGYFIIGKEAIRDTCCRYSGADEISYEKIYQVSPIGYLKFWKSHKGAERLMKCGLQEIVFSCLREYSTTAKKINWQENEPHKMLGVSRPAFAAIRSGRISWEDYLIAAKEFPNETLDNQIKYQAVIRYQYGTLETLCSRTKSSRETVMKYLVKQQSTIDIWYDYLNLSKEQGADMKDRAVLFPKNLQAAHDRRVEAREAIERERQNKELSEKMKGMLKARKKLEYSEGEYIIRQPISAEEIVAEGAALSHCVGGYAKRHAEGKLSIMFLRRKSEPDKPYYTIEVSTDFKIIQCRGYKNNVVNNGGEEKPEKIKQLEQHYQKYLNTIKAKKARKTA